MIFKSRARIVWSSPRGRSTTHRRVLLNEDEFSEECTGHPSGRVIAYGLGPGARRRRHYTGQTKVRGPAAEAGHGPRTTRGCVTDVVRPIHVQNFVYSALACFRMGMSGSASFQKLRKS